MALLLGGCSKPDFHVDLTFAHRNNRHEFSVSVNGGILYISGKYNGADITIGSSGKMMRGKEIFQASSADLDSDGNPEVYVFYRPPDLGPGIYAVTCREGSCESIGVEGSAGGREPEDYCGGDSFTLDKRTITWNYLACAAAPGARKSPELRALKYELGRTTFGLILRRAQ